MNHYKARHAPQFWIDKKGALKAGRELVERNLNLKGQKLDEYMMYNFDEIWDHFDVLRNGIVEIERMSSFYKRLLKDFTISI